MARLTILLRRNPSSGRQDIVIQLKSDADALPLEHERTHRQLVKRILELGVVTEGELGQLVIEREPECEAAGVDPLPATPERQARREDA